MSGRLAGVGAYLCPCWRSVGQVHCIHASGSLSRSHCSAKGTGATQAAGNGSVKECVWLSVCVLCVCAVCVLCVCCVRGCVCCVCCVCVCVCVCVCEVSAVRGLRLRSVCCSLGLWRVTCLVNSPPDVCLCPCHFFLRACVCVCRHAGVRTGCRSSAPPVSHRAAPPAAAECGRWKCPDWAWGQ